MLDEIINYVQSLQRQVEVNQDFLEIIEKKNKKNGEFSLQFRMVAYMAFFLV